MQYMGSKRRIAKDLLPIILKDRQPDQWYVEPFVGGCNMIDKVEGLRIGNDNNYYLIKMFQALQQGWLPPENVSKEEYYTIKNNIKTTDPEIVGFVGFLCSFGGKWWGGYAQNKEETNYAAAGKRSLLKQLNSIQSVVFTHGDYLNLQIPNNSIVYCDPPYENTTNYDKNFNHTSFWEWCRNLHKEGHQIFISEYNAPRDFTYIKSIEIKTTLDKNSQYLRTEKLFTL